MNAALIDDSFTVPNTPIVAANYSAKGAQTNGSSAVINTPFPAGVQAGYLLINLIANKYPPNVPNIPTNLVQVRQQSGGAGAAGLNSGNVNITVQTKIAVGTESGTNLANQVVGGNSTITQLFSLSKDVRLFWSNPFSFAWSINAMQTAWGSNCGNVTLQKDDIIVFALAANQSTIGFTFNSITHAGTVFGAITKELDSNATAGDRIRGAFAWCKVTSSTGVNNALSCVITAGGNTAGAVAIFVFRAQQTPDNYFDWYPDRTENTVVTADGQRMWKNSQNEDLRSSMHYAGSNYGKENVNGVNCFSVNINPLVPYAGVNLFNYRNEVEKWPNKPAYPIGTREIVARLYCFSNDNSKPRPVTYGEIGIGQNHPGSAPGGPYPENSPIYYFGLAFNGQNGGVQNQLRITNKVVDAITPGAGQLLVPGVIMNDNSKWIIIEDVYYHDTAGFLRVYVADVTTNPNTALSLVYDRTEPTVWQFDAQGGSNSLVGGNWKGLCYHQGLKTLAGYTAYAALNPSGYSYKMSAACFKNLVLRIDTLYRYADFTTFLSGLMSPKNVI